MSTAAQSHLYINGPKIIITALTNLYVIKPAIFTAAQTHLYIENPRVPIASQTYPLLRYIQINTQTDTSTRNTHYRNLLSKIKVDLRLNRHNQICSCTKALQKLALFSKYMDIIIYISTLKHLSGSPSSTHKQNAIFPHKKHIYIPSLSEI